MPRTLWKPDEDKLLKELAGVIPAEQIGTILNRPKNGVHHRMAKLGLDGRLFGDRHWNAKTTNLRAAMVCTLHDNGFKPKEIEESFKAFDMNRLQITELVVSGRGAR